MKHRVTRSNLPLIQPAQPIDLGHMRTVDHVRAQKLLDLLLHEPRDVDVDECVRAAGGIDGLV